MKRCVFLFFVLLLSLWVLPAAGQREIAEPAQELVIAMGAQPESLDPIAMASAPAATVGEHVAQPLIYLDQEGNLQPQLATSWEASEDGLTWTLKLREGVSFHDGTPFNADAVKKNLDRFLDPKSAAPYRFLIDQIKEVEAADAHTVRLHLDQPFAPIISHLSHSFIAMISPASFEQLPPGETVEMPSGTGPFVITRWARGEQIVVERNPDYYGDTPQLDKVTFKFVTEDAARVVMLETGEADAIMRVPPMDAQRLDGHNDIDIVYASSVRVIYIGYNAMKEPFTDPLVRQALNYAVDKQAIIDTILGGVGFQSTAPVVPAVFGHTHAGPYEYNPERARQLLAEAGFPDGFSTTLYHPTGRYLMDSTIAEAVQSMLKEVGVDARLQTMEWSAYLDFVRKPPEEAQHTMYMLGWGTVTLDADYGLYALLHSSQWPPAGWATSLWADDRVDELLDTARVTPEREIREELYEEAIQIIWDEAPWLFLHDEGQINGVRSNVKGLIHHPLENISAWDAWIE